MVMAHTRHIGSCTREQIPIFPSQVRLTGTIGTTSTVPKFVIVGPLYLSNLTNTTVGSDGGPFLNMISSTVPSEPFTRPFSVHRLAVSITRHPFASSN